MGYNWCTFTYEYSYIRGAPICYTICEETLIENFMSKVLVYLTLL